MRERGFEDLPSRPFVLSFSFPLRRCVLALNIASDSIKESEFFPEVIFKQVLIQSDPQSGQIWHIDMPLLN